MRWIIELLKHYELTKKILSEFNQDLQYVHLLITIFDELKLINKIILFCPMF